MFLADVFILYDTQYLHALQLLFAEGVLFLQRLILDLHTDELSLHLNTLILQLRYKTYIRYRLLTFLHSIFHLAYMQNNLVLNTVLNFSACFLYLSKERVAFAVGILGLLQNLVQLDLEVSVCLSRFLGHQRQRQM